MPYNHKAETPQSTTESGHPKKAPDQTRSTRASTSNTPKDAQNKTSQCTNKSPTTQKKAAEPTTLALTFGTLLSSQRTHAHPPRPLGPSGDNHVTVPALAMSINPSRPRSRRPALSERAERVLRPLRLRSHNLRILHPAPARSSRSPCSCPDVHEVHR